MTQDWLLIVAMMLLASVGVLQWVALQNKRIDLAYWKGYAATKDILAAKYLEIMVAHGLGDKALKAMNEVHTRSEKHALIAETDAQTEETRNQR